MLLEQNGILPLLDEWTDADKRLPPHFGDLEALYTLIRGCRAKVVMEFGCGYSTLVIAKALEKNKADWDGNVRPYKTKTHLFSLSIVEANNDGRWLAGTMENLRTRISVDNIRPWSCPVMIGTFRGMVCSYYTHIPNVLPDFVYLDGPDPMSVNGQIRGVHFNHPEALPMAADLLFIEPILLPGTTILVDGRTANFRFLKRNFQRAWETGKIEGIDMRWLKLTEAPLSE